MRLKDNLGRMLLVLQGVWLSLIVTLYLSPSKYIAADVSVVLLLLVLVIHLGVYRSGIIDGLRHLAPLFIVLLYAVGLDLVKGKWEGFPYELELFFSFLSFLAFYVTFRSTSPSQFKLLFVGVFILTGLIHLGYMWWDISGAIFKGKLQFLSSSKQGILEEIKDVPRVGRRYLSMALVHLLFGCVLLGQLFRRGPLKKIAYGLVAVAALSLGILDARGAYASIALGGVLLMLCMPRVAMATLRKIFSGLTLRHQFILMTLIIVALGVAYNAGKSRWIVVDYSFQAAVHDVLSSSEDVKLRPYVDRNFWDKPLDDPAKCYLEERFRCKVDQSMYLRTAWTMVGVGNLVKHPFGVGYSENYMGRLWGVEGDKSKVQRIDSFLAAFVVWFGFVGVTLYVYFGWGIVKTARSALKEARDAQSVMIVLIVMLILVCGVRNIFDLVTEGLWRYLMALAGMYYGMLYSLSSQRSENLPIQSH